jgi:hypothetical protein
VKRAARKLVAPLLVAVVALVFWDTVALYPLRIFVVLLHEVSHGLVAIITGGQLVRIGIGPDEGGVCYTNGGSRFLVLNAGYLGSLLWGALFLVLSVRGRAQRGTVLSMGTFTLGITLLYVRTAFGFAYGLVAGAVLVYLALRQGREVSAFVLQVVGVVSCLYAVFDVGSDVLSRRIAGSDAEALGRLTGIPGPAWGVLWVLISVMVVGISLRTVVRSGRPGIR